MELTTELSHVFQFDADRFNRHELILHMRRQMDAMPPQDQRRILAAAMKEALHGNLEQFRAMNTDERLLWLRRMNENATEHLQRLVKEDGAFSREELREFVFSAEAKEFLNEATSIIFKEMSAEERAELLPIFKKWVNMLQNF